jgi:hypothetical protein
MVLQRFCLSRFTNPLTARTLCLCLAFTVLAAAPGWAQERSGEAPEPPQIEAPEPPQIIDVGDLWRMIRHKDAATAEAGRRFVAFAPSIGSKPSTGLNGGFSGNMAFFRGDPQTTHISSLTAGLKVSVKDQTLGGIRFSMFTQDDRWFLQGDNRLQWTSLDTYDLGASAPQADAENAKFDLFRFYDTAYRNVSPGLFVGLGLNVSAHSNIRPGAGTLPAWDQSAYVAYTEKHGFAADGQTSSGASIAVLYDTRDNAINAERGVLASATYRTFFSGFLGGDATWQELNLDARTYRKLTAGGRNKLAFWFLGDLVTGGTAPYLDLPATATPERSARGYGEGRYRGEHLLYGEIEYRATLTKSGLFGFVAFLNTTTVDNTETGERLFAAYAPGAGFGFRLLLNKRSRTNLCTDYGWGKDGSRGFYLAIQEAF